MNYALVDKVSVTSRDNLSWGHIFSGASLVFVPTRVLRKRGGQAWNFVDYKSMILHSIPILGHFVRPRLSGQYVRDDGLQARELTNQLGILDAAGVGGTFVFTFVDPRHLWNEHPKHDLDMASYSLVKTYADEYGTTYPDMTWEPKESFYVVADYYARH